MHGMSLFMLKGRERTSAFLATIVCIATIVATAGKPRRTVVGGREVVEAVLFGHVVPRWLFLLIFAPVFCGLWFAIHRLMDRLWPQELNLVDSIHGDEPEARKNLVPDGPGTAMAYLRESTPEFLSDVEQKDCLNRLSAFHRSKALWRATATDAIMNGLISAARQIGDELDEQAVVRLVEAHEERGIPTLSELTILAGEIDSEGVRQYVHERAQNEESTTISVDKVFERPDGGFVAWSGDDPNARSPLDYVAPQLKTALDYLQAEEPAPIRVLVLGMEGAEREEAAFHAEMARWLEEANDETLRELVATARTFGPGAEDDLYFRLIDAHDARGIPTLEELEAFAVESGNEDIREYVDEKRDEQA